MPRLKNKKTGKVISSQAKVEQTVGENVEGLHVAQDSIVFPMNGDFESAESVVEIQEDENEPFFDHLTDMLYTTLSCRTVRIGSYKYFPTDPVIISENGLRLNVPSLEDKQKIVKVGIRFRDIIRVMVHFGRLLPVLFFITSPKTAAKVRELLGMESSEKPYYDPTSRDAAHKRITLLPETITDDGKQILREIFESKLEELSMSEANEILVRASPKPPAPKPKVRAPRYYVPTPDIKEEEP